MRSPVRLQASAPVLPTGPRPSGNDPPAGAPLPSGRSLPRLEAPSFAPAAVGGIRLSLLGRRFPRSPHWQTGAAPLRAHSVALRAYGCRWPGQRGPIFRRLAPDSCRLACPAENRGVNRLRSGWLLAPPLLPDWSRVWLNPNRPETFRRISPGECWGV